jgi:hypothetical protein
MQASDIDIYRRVTRDKTSTMVSSRGLRAWWLCLQHACQRPPAPVMPGIQAAMELLPPWLVHITCLPYPSLPAHHRRTWCESLAITAAHHLPDVAHMALTCCAPSAPPRRSTWRLTLRRLRSRS